MPTASETLVEDQQTLTPYLLPSESILWTGRPPDGILFRKIDGLMIPFSLLWGGFAFFWEYTVYQSGGPVFFLIWGGMFVVVGLYFIFGRFVVDMLVRMDTVYAVTSERVLILSGLFSRSLKAFNLNTLQEVTLEQSGNGKGTITFGPTRFVGIGSYYRYGRGSRNYAAPRFEQIDNAGEVYRLIHDTGKR